MEETWFTVKEISELLKLNPETVRRAIQRGKLKSAKFGKVYRVSKDDLEIYINNAKGKTPNNDNSEKRRFSLQGIISGSTVTDEDLEEVKKIWESRPLP